MRGSGIVGAARGACRPVVGAVVAAAVVLPGFAPAAKAAAPEARRVLPSVVVKRVSAPPPASRPVKFVYGHKLA